MRPDTLLYPKRVIVGAILALVFLYSAWADTTGLVVSVHDGDTLTVLIEKQQVKVRLAEIDAPELRQAFGQRFRQSLADLCFQQSAKVAHVARDQYGRSVGTVQCAGTDAAAHQAATSMAWVFDRYSKPTSPLYRLQDGAKTARRGLCADNEPVPPWEWRRERAFLLALKRCTLGTSIHDDPLAGARRFLEENGETGEGCDPGNSLFDSGGRKRRFPPSFPPNRASNAPLLDYEIV